MTQPAGTILVVEDSPDDYEATHRALRQGGIANKVRWCQDGDEALDYLLRRGEYADAEVSPRPDLILLDLNLPGTDGGEVLAAIKQNENLKRIPVVVLTTSDDPIDIRSCYDSGANSYVQKPVEFSRFIEAVQRLKDYWFKVVVIPKGEAAERAA